MLSTKIAGSTEEGRRASTLLDVATDLFAERGYEGTSIEAVLQRAGVSRGSLYHHFAGKESLFGAVVESVHARVGEATLAETQSLGDADAHALLRTGYLVWVRLAGRAHRAPDPAY